MSAHRWKIYADSRGEVTLICECRFMWKNIPTSRTEPFHIPSCPEES